MNDIFNFLIRSLLELACLLFVVRFLIQACQADYYNPICQALVRVTDPVLRPLGRVLPVWGNLHLGAFGFAWACLVVMAMALEWIANGTIGFGPQLFILTLLHLLLRFLDVFWWCILIVAIASFLTQGRYHPALALLAQITEPLLEPVRRVLPAVGGLDFSPVVALLLLGVLQRALPALFGNLL